MADKTTDAKTKTMTMTMATTTMERKRPRPSGDEDDVRHDDGDNAEDLSSASSAPSMRRRPLLAAAAASAPHWYAKTVIPPNNALYWWLKGTDPLFRGVTYVLPGSELVPAPTPWHLHRPCWHFDIDARNKMPPVTDPRMLAEAVGSKVPPTPSNGKTYADRGYNRLVVVTETCAVALIDGWKRTIGVGELVDPAYVAARGDFVAVTEPSHARVVVFRYDVVSDTYVVHSRIAGVVHNPQGLAFLPDGVHIAVAETCTHSVAVLTLEGEHVRTLGGGGMLSFPMDVACFRNGTVAVADRGNARVAVFHADTGELVATMQTAEAVAEAARADRRDVFLTVPLAPSALPGHEVITAVAAVNDECVAAYDARGMRTLIFQCPRT